MEMSWLNRNLLVDYKTYTSYFPSFSCILATSVSHWFITDLIDFEYSSINFDLNWNVNMDVSDRHLHGKKSLSRFEIETNLILIWCKNFQTESNYNFVNKFLFLITKWLIMCLIKLPVRGNWTLFPFSLQHHLYINSCSTWILKQF